MSADQENVKLGWSKRFEQTSQNSDFIFQLPGGLRRNFKAKHAASTTIEDLYTVELVQGRNLGEWSSNS